MPVCTKRYDVPGGGGVGLLGRLLLCELIIVGYPTNIFRLLFVQ